MAFESILKAKKQQNQRLVTDVYRRIYVIFLNLIPFMLIFITLIGIEGQLRKGYKQNERIIELLEEINDKHPY
jgi:hypothetical protein